MAAWQAAAVRSSWPEVSQLERLASATSPQSLSQSGPGAGPDACLAAPPRWSARAGHVRARPGSAAWQGRDQPLTKDVSSSPLITLPSVATWVFTGPTPGASQSWIAMLTVNPAIDSEMVLLTIVV